jgi:hypothetical protein
LAVFTDSGSIAFVSLVISPLDIDSISKQILQAHALRPDRPRKRIARRFNVERLEMNRSRLIQARARRGSVNLIHDT